MLSFDGYHETFQFNDINILYHLNIRYITYALIQSCFPHSHHHLSLLNLLPQNPFERNRIRRKFRNPLPQLLDRHGLLVEVEPEQRFVVEVGLLGDVEGGGVFGVEFLGNFVGGAVELF